VIDLEASYQLSPNVSLRPERFGALAYSFDTRKLSFLKHPDLLRVVESLDSYNSVRQVFEAVGVEKDKWPSFLIALATLETSEMIRAA